MKIYWTKSAAAGAIDFRTHADPAYAAAHVGNFFRRNYLMPGLVVPGGDTMFGALGLWFVRAGYGHLDRWMLHYALYGWAALVGHVVRGED